MVSIDMPAGPSEVLVIADKYASPAHIAADLLSQVNWVYEWSLVWMNWDFFRFELLFLSSTFHRRRNISISD